MGRQAKVPQPLNPGVGVRHVQRGPGAPLVGRAKDPGHLAVVAEAHVDHVVAATVVDGNLHVVGRSANARDAGSDVGPGVPQVITAEHPATRGNVDPLRVGPVADHVVDATGGQVVLAGDVGPGGAGVEAAEEAAVGRGGQQRVAADHRGAEVLVEQNRGVELRPAGAAVAREVQPDQVVAGESVTAEPTGAGEDGGRRGRVQRYGADRQRRQVVGQGGPGGERGGGIGRPPDAAVDGADVHDVGVGRVRGDRLDGPGHPPVGGTGLAVERRRRTLRQPGGRRQAALQYFQLQADRRADRHLASGRCLGGRDLLDHTAEPRCSHANLARGKVPGAGMLGGDSSADTRGEAGLPPLGVKRGLRPRTKATARTGGCEGPGRGADRQGSRAIRGSGAFLLGT